MIQQPLKRYLDVFGASQIKIVIFEDFIADQQGSIDEVTDFIGAPRMDLATAQTWFNQTFYPTRPKAQLLLNRVGRRIVARRYRSHMGPGQQTLMDRLHHKLHYRWFRDINPIFLKAQKPPQMAEETRRYLSQHLTARNAGLSELLGRDMSQTWKGFGA